MCIEKPGWSFAGTLHVEEGRRDIMVEGFTSNMILWVALGVIGLLALLFIICRLRRSSREPHGGELPALRTNLMHGDMNKPGPRRNDAVSGGGRAAVSKFEDASSAALNAQFYLRSTSDCQFVEALLMMGSRTPVQKSQFLVKQGHGRSSDYKVMTMVFSGSACTAKVQNRHQQKGFKSLLTGLDHPYILPINTVDFQAETQCAVLMRPFESKGSLRDYINRTNPKVDFNVKYKNGEAVGDSITEKKIAKFGRQILEGLHYMHTMGLSHLNLNAGNVIVDNSVCTLTDCENSMLGFVPRNHQLIVPLVQQYQKVFSKEVEQEHIEMTPSEKEDTPLLDLPAISHPAGQLYDVICFGHVLFEMATGYELPTPNIDGLPPVPRTVERILKSIFKPDKADAKCPPTLQDLLLMPFFQQVELKQRDERMKPRQPTLNDPKGRVKEWVDCSIGYTAQLIKVDPLGFAKKRRKKAAAKEKAKEGKEQPLLLTNGKAEETLLLTDGKPPAAGDDMV